MPSSPSTRHPMRRLAVLAAALLCGAIAPRIAAAQAHDHAGHGMAAHAGGGAKPRVKHPQPRAGVTAERVLPPEQVRESAREVYTMAAHIPSVLDGLFCHCDCHERDGKRSLLECFEGEMGSTCGICSGEARLAYELYQQGKTLEEIREGVDERYAW